LVFIPLDLAGLTRLRQGHDLGATPAWAAADESEEAEQAALLEASLDGLARHGARLVLVAQAPFAAPSADGSESEDGPGRVRGLAWRQATALFADDPANLAQVRSAGAAVVGRGWQAALREPAAIRLAREQPLLWYDASEVGRGLIELPTVDGLGRV
jgi:hypothetical protein